MGGVSRGRCPMPTKVSLRPLSPEDRQAVEALARSRTDEARTVERARIIAALAGGMKVAAAARQLGVSRPTVYRWVARFNLQGPDGLRDMPRSGRPATYPPEQVAEVLAAALADPQSLGLPYGSWTLDRLRDYLNGKGVGMKRSRIDEILIAEGLRWHQQESWFGERVDPEFAAKRGRSSGSTPNHPRDQSPSASTRWGRPSPRRSPARGSSGTTPGSSPTAPAGPPGGPRGRSSRASGSGAGTSSAPSGRPPGRRSPPATRRGTGPTGSTSSNGPTGGSRRT